MGKRLLILALVLFGVGVGLTSLYFSSLSGLMGKLGLVGGDLSRAVRVNDLVRNVYEVGSPPECSYWESIKSVPRYLFMSKNGERVSLGLELGERRVGCGINYILDSNYERGIYTIVKGLYYERASHLLMLELVGQSKSNCDLFTPDRNYGFIEAYINSSEGNAERAVSGIYGAVVGLRESVAERCIDELL